MRLQTDYPHKNLDPVRRRILELLPESRSNLRMASVAIDRNAAYLHQFIHRHTPRVLAEHDREALAGASGLQARRTQARAGSASKAASEAASA